MDNTAIDLLWLRPGKVGGTESYIRNLLDGFVNLKEDFLFTLLVSLDNAETFRQYGKDERFRLLVAPVRSENIAKRILWQNMFQNRFLRKHGFRKCFEPVYCKPWLNGRIRYTCVIHDLQALHYPQYHPFHEAAYSRLCWRMDVVNGARIIAISQWVREDLERRYHRHDIEVIYNPILIKKNEKADFGPLGKRYGIEKKQFFYTVSQMIASKNLETLIRMMDRLLHGASEDKKRAQAQDLPGKLVISGVNGHAAKEFMRQMEDRHLQDAVVLTGYISNEERNCLYESCHTFLFPSVFEGFGMPPVEAMLFGTPVVTTRCASIPEVTQGKAVYVEDPYNVEEWICKINEAGSNSGAKDSADVTDALGNQTLDFSRYAPERISGQYLAFLKEPVWKKK